MKRATCSKKEGGLPNQTAKKIYPHTKCERRHLGLLSGRNSTGNTSRLYTSTIERKKRPRALFYIFSTFILLKGCL